MHPLSVNGNKIIFPRFILNIMKWSHIVEQVGREVKLYLLAGVGKPGASGDNR